MKFCFVFICQKGELELKSMLLATSLRENIRGDYELVAAVPEPKSKWGEISAVTKKMIKQLDIRIENIRNEVDINYPIGNKVSCFKVKTNADKIIFLDSDIICMKPFLPKEHFNEQFCAKPVDKHWFNEWKHVYELFEIPYPKERFETTIDKKKILPYFNAGLIVVDNNIKFSEEWIKCCKIIDEAKNITDKRPWLDQIALPIVVKKKQLKCKILDNKYNYPIHELVPIKSEIPFFCHYHYRYKIFQEKNVFKYMEYLIKKYPLLKKYAKILPEWRGLFYPYPIIKSKIFIKKILVITYFKIKNILENIYFMFYYNKNKKQLKNAIITGIPRSGTSYLCKLLHSRKNTVVINEPEYIRTIVSRNKKLWRLKSMYNILRKKINSGKVVNNKIKNGKIIEDTAKTDTRTYSIHKVENRDFCLITKNTLAYLFALPQIINEYPEMPIIACIRNPLDTIASWKKNFQHLRYVRFENFPVNINHKNNFSEKQIQEITQIKNENDFEIKRALLWNFLAQIIYENKEKIVVLKYENFVTNTNYEIKKIQEKYPQFEFKLDFYNSEIRSDISVLHKEEREKIIDICKKTAEKFGYNYY